ncbi:MAG: PKD domain-containing protein, partial [Fibrobacterota bacterium]
GSDPVLIISPEKAAPGDTVKFTAAGVPEGALLRFDFNGDGRWDTRYDKTRVLRRTFRKDGGYRPAVSIKTGDNKTILKKASFTVNTPPEASIKIKRKPGTSSGFEFQAVVKDNYDRSEALKVSWDFDGDREWDTPFSNSKHAEYIYPNVNVYNVILKVMDTHGGVTTVEEQIVVGYPPEITVTEFIRTGINTETKMSAEASDRDGKIVKYSWDFDGDGKEDWESPKSGLARHKWKIPGLYKAVATAYSDDGQSVSAEVVVEVVNFPLTAGAGKDKSVLVNDTVWFTGSGNDRDGKVSTFEWDFDGDGNIDTLLKKRERTAFVFNEKGNYSAVLTVTNEAGEKAFDTVAIEVKNTPPEAFAGEDIVLKGPGKVVLEGKGKDREGGKLTFSWDYDGDGKWDYEGPSGKVKNKFREYSYSVLKVTDSDGDSGYDTTRIIICPKGMETVEKYKYCIDTYEWPNKKGEIPQVNVSYEEADELCKAAGKRLCSSNEWMYACMGEKEYSYPYGYDYNSDKCNTGGQSLMPSGYFRDCESDYDIFDMSGNLAEWTYKPNNPGNAYARGGSFHHGRGKSDCKAKMRKTRDSRFGFIGFRCCK